MLLKEKVAVIYGAGGAVGALSRRLLPKKEPGSFYPAAQSPRLRRLREGLRRMAELRKQLRSTPLTRL